MYLNESIKCLFNKYDKAAFESLDELSNNQAYKIKELFTEGVNLNEAFETFNTYIEGYIQYKLQSVENPSEKIMPLKTITENAHYLVDNKLFFNSRILYTDVKNYIESYMNGVNKVMKTIDDGKVKLFEANIDNESIGALDEFSEYFIDKLNDKFYPFIEKMLWASGYTGKKKMQELINKSETYTFL